MNVVTEVAIEFSRWGWSVIPVHVPIITPDEIMCSCGRDCAWPGKHPRVRWREFTSRRPTEEQLTDWFEDEFYGSNLGVVTGSVSGLVVVDVDGDIEEFERLKLPKTALTARTGSGGRHFFYTLPAGQTVQSGPLRDMSIDIKGEGGFVVIPPSRHLSGDDYRWLSIGGPSELRPSQLPARDTPTHGQEDGWYREMLAGVTSGERSNSAARLAGRYAALGLTIEEACMLMDSWNLLNVPPLSASELGSTIRSVYQKHRAQDRKIDTFSDLYSLLDEATGRRDG